MCQRARGSLEEATKLGSDRPVGGDSPRDGAGRAWMRTKKEETWLQGTKMYRSWF